MNTKSGAKLLNIQHYLGGFAPGYNAQFDPDRYLLIKLGSQWSCMRGGRHFEEGLQYMPQGVAEVLVNMLNSGEYTL